MSNYFDELTINVEPNISTVLDVYCKAENNGDWRRWLTMLIDNRINRAVDEAMEELGSRVHCANCFNTVVFREGWLHDETGSAYCDGNDNGPILEVEISDDH